MSASVRVHWPDATEEEQLGHPGFFNDVQPWVSWIAAIVANQAAIRRLTSLGFDALLAYTTGAAPNEVAWTTPEELERAANGLRRLVQRGEPIVEALVEIYEADAPGFEKASVEFARDLGDVAEIAAYARGCGASAVTLGYYG